MNWIIEMRPFYSSKEFTAAYKAFKMGGWKTAEDESLWLSKSPDLKFQGKAAYNLGVLYENLGKQSEMDYWYNEANVKLGSLPAIPDWLVLSYMVKIELSKIDKDNSGIKIWVAYISG